MSRSIQVFLVVLGTTLGGLIYFNSHNSAPIPQTQPTNPAPIIVQPPPKPRQPDITTKIPGYKDYAGCVAQIKEWNQQAPDFTTVGTYGKSSQGIDLYYIKVTNKYSPAPKPVILVHGCIHGNESWATGEVMAWLGTMLGTYVTDKQVTDLIDKNEIYFVPVVSPDSYPHSRIVDGQDPNRNFPNPRNPNIKSVPPVAAIQDLTLKIKPKVAISAHTFGRVFLSPWGDQNQVCPNEADYNRIFGQMCQLSGYGQKRACQVYGTPIYGGELDWYFRQGALSMVIEIGTHQTIPSLQEITSEFDKTYKSILFFMEEGLKVRVIPEKISIYEWDEDELQEAA
jgi:Zinc carboxypeptidase